MKILLVAIVKNENRYLDEWIDYHYNIGFDQIVLCDNNDIDGEIINNDKVIIENFRGQHKERHIKIRYYGTQQDAYNFCYKKYNKDYDWIAFLDIDEFLTPVKTDIKTYLLSLPNDADVVYINWKCYGDNEHIYYENKPVQERFTTPINKCCNQNIPYDGVELFKSIVRGKGRCKTVYCHTCKVIGNAVNADGEYMRNFRYMHVYAPVKYDNIYIKHYVTKSVEEFFSGKELKVNSNVQFGEGGAGTFSDGKLNSGIKDPRCRAVLKEFVSHGAQPKILTDAKPHIGTDILVDVVKNIRKEIISLGGTVLFETKLEKINTYNNKVSSIIANGKEIICDKVILATGHSARDVFSFLKESGVEMERKPFSVGVRIEHLQEDINKALYGKFYNHPNLSAADYKLAVHLENGRGVYTFCMCPGGEVINSSSEQGGIAVNGMSYSRRDGVNANSAVLVGVNPDDFSGDDVLAGCEFQREIEQKAYNIANGKVPVTTVGQLAFGEQFEVTDVKPTVKPEYVFKDVKEILEFLKKQ